jgi:hypothetical protein
MTKYKIKKGYSVEFDGRSYPLQHKPVEETLAHKEIEKGMAIAYLVHDEVSHPYFLEEAKLLTSRRGTQRSQILEIYDALGLDSDGSPAIYNIPESDVTEWLLKNRPHLSDEGLEDETIRDAAALELWKQGVAEGTIGDKYALLLSVYSHSGEVWAVAGSAESLRWPDQQWDVAHGAGLWVPGPDLRKYIDDKVKEGAAFADTVREFAKSWLQTYNAWSSGEVYGVVLERFGEGQKPDPEESCWGFIGYEDALQERDEWLKAAAGEAEAIEVLA